MLLPYVLSDLEKEMIKKYRLARIRRKKKTLVLKHQFLLGSTQQSKPFEKQNVPQTHGGSSCNVLTTTDIGLKL